MKILNPLLNIFLAINSYAQNINFRKAILKNDLIIASNDFAFETIRINNYTNTSYLQINKIDTILKTIFL
jgi:hypothetical protein